MYRKIKKLLCIILILSFVIPTLGGCRFANNSANNKISDTQICLDTFATITLYQCNDAKILENAFSLIKKYENIFSRTNPDSEVYQINHSDASSFTVSPELAELLAIAQEYSELTEGAFDYSIGSVSSLWDFKSEEKSVPANSSIENGLAHVDYHNFSLNGTVLTRSDADSQLEFGGIAKGYIADKVKDYLLEQGVTSAIINLGGNILCVGSKPDGSAFNIGVEVPFSEKTELITTLEVDDGTVVTSGIYQRYFETSEGFYHHILNPETGYPVENNLTSVTIITKNSAAADALSTACFVLGFEKGKELVESLDDVSAIFVDKEGEVYSVK